MTRELMRWLAPFAVGVVVGLVAWGWGAAVHPLLAGAVVFVVGRGVNYLGGLVPVQLSAFER